jgi:hypothetical protein
MVKRVLVLLALLATTATSSSNAGPLVDHNPALSGSQGCLGARTESGSPAIAWSTLRNPIVAYPHHAVRDIAIRARHGRWQLAMTSVRDHPFRFRIAQTASRGWQHWSKPVVRAHLGGASNVVSPDITRGANGRYVETFDGVPHGQQQLKLFYRTSTNLVRWSRTHRLMPHVFGGTQQRLIDAALAWTHHGLFLGYKRNVVGGAQHFELAWSRSGRLTGPWTYVGRPDITVYGDTVENYEFLEIDQRWRLLATSNQLDRPWLFALDGNAAQPSGWLNWSRGRELELPLESWNRAAGVPGVSFDEANSAYLCDARRIDGWYYLFYIGATSLKGYGGFGHTKLGVARSHDLVTWSVPCGPHGRSTPSGCVGAG